MPLAPCLPIGPHSMFWKHGNDVSGLSLVPNHWQPHESSGQATQQLHRTFHSCAMMLTKQHGQDLTPDCNQARSLCSHHRMTSTVSTPKRLYIVCHGPWPAPRAAGHSEHQRLTGRVAYCDSPNHLQLSRHKPAFLPGANRKSPHRLVVNPDGSKRQRCG